MVGDANVVWYLVYAGKGRVKERFESQDGTVIRENTTPFFYNNQANRADISHVTISHKYQANKTSRYRRLAFISIIASLLFYTTVPHSAAFCVEEGKKKVHRLK